jgi:predicted nucleic acid-binding protein
LAVWDKDADWLAPEIWQSEFRNALAMMLRHRHIGIQTALEAYRLATGFVETLPAGTGTVLQLCEQYPISAYDAEFAALAEHLGIVLVSFDAELVASGLAVAPEDFAR